MTRDEPAVERFVEAMARVFGDWGFPRMAARVLMTLMSADEPTLTAADLAERLDASPAAVSGAVRYLTQIRVVDREPVRGSRRDHYKITNGGWYAVTLLKGDLFAGIANVADDGVKALGGAGTPSGDRVVEMRDFFRFVQKETAAMMDRWQESRRAGTT